MQALAPFESAVIVMSVFVQGLWSGIGECSIIIDLTIARLLSKWDISPP